MLRTETEILNRWNGLEPKISICCITYNHEKFLEKAIDSFLSQVCDVPFEIVIGEDCSTDATLTILNKYKLSYPNLITIVTSEINVGGQENFIRVVDRARGEYIAICEGDDYFFDEFKLQKSYDYMREHTDVSMLFTPAMIIKDFTITEQIRNYYSDTFISNINLEWILKNGGGFYPTPTSFFKSEVLKNRPKWFNKHCAGDYAIAIWSILNGRIGYLSDVTSAYRVNSGSMSSPIFESREKAKQKFRLNQKKNLAFFDALREEGILNEDMLIYLRAKEDYMYYAKLMAFGYPYSFIKGFLKIRRSYFFKIRILLKAILFHVFRS